MKYPSMETTQDWLVAIGGLMCWGGLENLGNAGALLFVLGGATLVLLGMSLE